MSARLWKMRLEECQAKLGNATMAASEWKDVADNRLELLHRLDRAFTSTLEALIDVGEIFGVAADLPEDVWTPTDTYDGGTTAMYIMGKLEAAAVFQRNLLQQAIGIQSALHDTYDIACQAVEVSRPTEDLVLPVETNQTREPSSPLSEFEKEVNNIDPPSSSDPPHWTESSVVVRPKGEESNVSRALSLFK